MRTLTFLLATLALMPGNWGSAADFAKQWIAELILLSVLVFGVRYVMRFNVLGCFLVVALTALVPAGGELVRQPDRFYRFNAYAVGVALVVLLAWPFFKWGARRGNDVETQPANRA
jgi:hypothetical protein